MELGRLGHRDANLGKVDSLAVTALVVKCVLDENPSARVSKVPHSLLYMSQGCKLSGTHWLGYSRQFPGL